MIITHCFLFRVVGYITRTIYKLLGHYNISRFDLIRNEYRRYKSSDIIGVAFSPLPDAELKIQSYYKTEEKEMI